MGTKSERGIVEGCIVWESRDLKSWIVGRMFLVEK